jgi:hypothetical protein
MQFRLFKFKADNQVKMGVGFFDYVVIYLIVLGIYLKNTYIELIRKSVGMIYQH